MVLLLFPSSTQKMVQSSSSPPMETPSSRKWKPLVEEKNHFAAEAIVPLTFEVLSDINRRLTPRQKALFRQTCFGEFLGVERLRFSGNLVHQILLRQLECTDGSESRSMAFEIGGKWCEFGLKEFALITGLDCTDYTLPRPGNGGFRQKFFEGKQIVSFKNVKHCFNNYNGGDDVDAVKLALLYLLEGFLLSKVPERVCEDFSIELVSDIDRFNEFPWGSFVHDLTVTSLRRGLKRKLIQRASKPNLEGSSLRYHLNGFPFALQYWAYECIPVIGEKFGHKNGSSMPRMLNWGWNKQSLSHTLKGIFKSDGLHVERGLEPTEREKGVWYFCRFLEPSGMRAEMSKDESTDESANGEKGTTSDDEVTQSDGPFDEVYSLPRDGVNAMLTKVLKDNSVIREELSVLREATKENFALSKKILVTVTEISAKCFGVVEPVRDEPRKRKRSNSRGDGDIDIPCFTIDPLEHPDSGEKTEFDNWIKIGLYSDNNERVYGIQSNKLNPAFDFDIQKCDKKDWFFSLNEASYPLSSSHIDVALYFIRKKKRNRPHLFKRQSTTTDSRFYVMLNSKYRELNQDSAGYLLNKEDLFRKVLEGSEPRESFPWVDMDFVYIPVNVSDKHWVLAAFDLKQQRLEVYSSCRGAKLDEEVKYACRPVAELLPRILTAEGLFSDQKDLKEATTTALEVKLVDNVPQQDHGGDSGMFMLKFTEFLMQDVPLMHCDRKTISFFRNKMAVELFSYAKKRMEEE